jgi:hypothetical protein
MLLEGTLHDLSLTTNSPDTDLTLVTSRDDLLAILSACKSSDTVVVSVIDSEEELTRLRKEGTNLTIVPAG